ESGQIIDSLGWVYYKMGEIEKAVVELERAIKYMPNDSVVFEHLGDVYLKKGLKGKAVEFYEKAVRLDAKNEKLKGKLDELKKNGNEE
ncbi:MAG: tetratricopeptide repeat protein, partial [Deltaproteobacteria bacterium]|nr:tetratricopeptide repeat protein [Deltaproteobacteria bacterium]